MRQPLRPDTAGQSPVGMLRWVHVFLQRSVTDGRAYVHDGYASLKGSLLRGGAPAYVVTALAGVAIAGLVVVMVVNPTVRVSAPSASASAPCRPSAMEHIHNPTRLVVVGRCSTVTGMVRRAAYDPRDGDTVISVAVDAPYRRFLRAEDQGELTVKVIPTDVPTVRIPLVGEHATFHGAWVLNRNADRRAEMHPAWSIVADVEAATETPQAGRVAAPSSPPASGETATTGRLRLTVDVPDSVPVGAEMPVTVTARQGEGDQEEAASEVRLFLEVASEAGDGIRWNALSTNTLGTAAWHMVTLQPPGKYMLTAYAEKDGRSTSSQVEFRVRRR